MSTTSVRAVPSSRSIRARSSHLEQPTAEGFT